MKSSPPKSDSKSQKIYSNAVQNFSNRYDPNLIKIIDKPFPQFFLTKKLSTNTPVVLKVYKFDDKTLFEAFFSELQHILQTNMKIYIDVIEYFAIKDQIPYELYIFLERADFTLSELISSISENVPKPEQELLQMYSDLAFNLSYAHQNNLTHGNIHPNNIMVFCNCRERPPESQKFNVFTTNLYKFSDWRFDTILQKNSKKDSLHEIFPKNCAFRPPEYYNCVRREDLDLRACDVYSLAMSLLNCCGMPLKKLLPISISEREIHDIQLDKIFHELTKIYDSKLVEILRNSLMFDPYKRWNIENVVFALKNLSKSSTMPHMDNINEAQEKKPKRGILKKLFSGIFKKKKSKNNNEINENAVANSNKENVYEYNLHMKIVALQVYCNEDYSSIFNQKQARNTSNDIQNLWKNIKPQTLNAMKLEFRTENNFGNENLELYGGFLKENAKIKEIARVSLISTPEKFGGDLGNFLARFYFSNSLMEGENSLFEHSLNMVHYFQKNQNAGLTNEEIIILLKNLQNLEKSDIKSLNLIFKRQEKKLKENKIYFSYEKLSDEPLKYVSYMIQNYAENLNEFNFFFTGQNISDDGVIAILKSLSDVALKSPVISLDKIGLGFGGKKKLTDASLIETSKTLITLSSRINLTRLFLYFNSFELSNEGLDSLGAALGNLSKTLTDLNIFLITWEQITDEGVLLLLRDLILKSKNLRKVTIGLKSVGLTAEGIGIIFGLLSKTESKLQNLNVYYEQMSNRNIDLERDFKEKLQKVHPDLVFGEIYVKV